MRPKQQQKARHDDLFRARLDQIINLKHELVVLADKIDWVWLDAQLAGCFSDEGRPAEPVRFMLGMFLQVPIDAMEAKLDFEDFTAGDSFMLDRSIKISTCKLNHPDNATAYRIDFQGASLCYVTDTEHVVGKPDENILGLIEGADLLVYDSTYTDKEFEHKIGWGHST